MNPPQLVDMPDLESLNILVNCCNNLVQFSMEETLDTDFPKITIQNALLHTTIPINFSRKRYSYNRDLLAEDSYETELTKIQIYGSTIPRENAIKLDNMIRKRLGQ